MHILRVFLPVLASVVLIGCQSGAKREASASGTVSLDQDFARFLQWFPGEYDNHEQVWQQAQDGVPEQDRHEHIHHIFQAVQAPAVGKHTFFVKQYMDGDYENVYRQRLYSFSKNPEAKAVQLTIYSFNDEKRYRYTDKNPNLIQSITPEELRTIPGCEVYWRYNGEYFTGVMKDKACKFYSERSKQTIYITDTLRLTSSEIWIGDKAFDAGGNKIFGRDEQHKNRKVRYFKGWAAMRRSKIDPAAEKDDWLSVKDLRIHNEGQRISFIADDGTTTGYALELAQLTYQNTKQPILKLGLIDEASGETITYAWADVGSTRLGMNLRWIQAGLTAE